MAKDAHMPRAPRLPAGCVDMNKLNDAARRGADPADAIGAARVTPRREQPKAKPASTTKAPSAPSKE